MVMMSSSSYFTQSDRIVSTTPKAEYCYSHTFFALLYIFIAYIRRSTQIVSIEPDEFSQGKYAGGESQLDRPSLHAEISVVLFQGLLPGKIYRRLPSYVQKVLPGSSNVCFIGFQLPDGG